MINKKGLKFCAVFLAAAQIPMTALAADWRVDGGMEVKKADSSYNVNPWNVAEISAGAQDGKINMVTVDGIVEVSLDTPLYSLSDGYTDRIVQKDGIWGVERNVAVAVFDGSEDWELYSQPGYQNSNTVIFTCTAPAEYRIQNGVSTHFDVVLDKEQKNRIYDGISFGREEGTVLMRFMKVRGISDTDSLKNYLKGQYDSGRPVKLLYPAAETVFVPFDEAEREKLAESEVLGISSGGLLSVSQNEPASLPGNVFEADTSLNAELDSFLAGISKADVHNSVEGTEYYLEGVYTDSLGLTIKAEDSDGGVYTGTVNFNDTDFLRSQITDITLKGAGDTEIRLSINLSKVKVPYKSITGFKLKLSDSCVKNSELVLPEYMVLEEGTDIYPENGLIYGGDTADSVKITEKTDSFIKISDGCEEKEIRLEESGNSEKTTVLFIGDSLINENYYTLAVGELDSDITFLGTRGSEGAAHEGRGGWSARDYCVETSKYGFSNPFLFDGEFNFKHYMDANKYEGVDTVVLNLGINDLNMTGHNSHEEILGYFSDIIDSIHGYDSEINILINTPIMPYKSEDTEARKNDRLEFIKSLYSRFGGMEEQGVIIVPVYLAVDTENRYKFTEPVIDEFNQDYGLVVTDATHPSIAGYGQMAGMTYSYIKYAGEIR